MEEEEGAEILYDDDDASIKKFALDFVVNIINYAVALLSLEGLEARKDSESGGEIEDSEEEDEEEDSEEEDEEDDDVDDDEDNEMDLYGRWSMVDTTGMDYVDANALELAGENKYAHKFCYNYPKLCSKPFTSTPSIIGNNLLTLYSTYGYDCKRLYNLIALDHTVLAYLAGNYVVFYNFKKNKKKYLRSLGGTGLSAIAVDSDKNFFAVGERGIKPTINIFHYPNFILLRMLKNGAEKQFAYLDFNSDSSLLASLSGEPDYTLAIWDWANEMITWRSKAFSQDVFKVTFSSEFPDKLITSGVGHIKFWTMADTFTGCKLQGVLGKFGHVELSDIRGFAEISGDRAISGSEWGNILLWEDGICVAEITRKGKTCHDGSIEQIVNDNGSILSVGLDGVIRVWDIEERIAERDIEQLKWEMDPLDEVKIGKRSELTYLIKVDKSSASDSGVWLVQDRNGAIWMIDLSFSLNSFEPRSLVSSHAGAVYACVTSPITQLLATAGEDCTIRVYDYLFGTQLLVTKYNSSVTSMIWLPLSVDKTGGTLVAGFSDGVVRMVRFQQKSDHINLEMKLCDVIKPHNGSVTKLSFKEELSLLASGSKDKTVFFFTIFNSKLNRIGFVQTAEPVTNLSWSPPTSTRLCLLVSCERGQVVEFDVSNIFLFDNSQSYHLTDLSHREFQFKMRRAATKTGSLQDHKARHSARRSTTRFSTVSLSRIGQISHMGHMEIPEDNEEEEEEEEEVFGGEYEDLKKCQDSYDNILFAFYTDDMSAFWISVDGQNAGYLHECSFDDQNDQLLLDSSKLIPAVGSCARCYLYHAPNQLMFFGTGNGSIAAYDFSRRKLNAMDHYYVLTVLDSKGADIRDICLSYNDKHLFLAGQDGNIFCFKIHFKQPEGTIDEASILEIISRKAVFPPHKDLPDVEDITDSSAASLEDSMTFKRLMEAKAKAEESKKLTLETLKKMQKTFKELVLHNQKLPPHLRLFREEYEMDPVFEIEATKKREEMMESARRQLLFDSIKTDLTLKKVQERYTDREEWSLITVKALNSDLKVTSYRLSVQPQDLEMIAERLLLETRVGSKILESENASKNLEENTSPDTGDDTSESRDLRHQNLYEKLKKMGNQGLRKIKMFQKMEAQRLMREKRKKEWDEFLVSEPRLLESGDSEDDVIKEAKFNLGDMKLKTAVGDKVTLEKQKLTLEKSTLGLINHLIQQYQLKKHYNILLLKLRDRKRSVISDWWAARARLNELMKFNPDASDVTLPEIDLEMNVTEYPEWRFRINTVSQRVEFQDTPIVSKSSGDKMLEPSLNDLEEMLVTRDRIESKYEQENILKEMQKKVKFFDANLLYLRSIKFSLDSYFKQGELRELLLLQEKMKMFEMLKEEEVLSAILNSKLKDELEYQKKIEDLNQRIEKGMKEVAKLMIQQNQMEKTFMSIIPENYKFTEFLVKVYKQKVRRKVQTDYRTGAGEDEEDDEEDDLDEEEFDDDEENYDEEDDNYMNLDVCPEGCNIALYEKTIQLRENRLDILEKITENKKMKDGATKELEVRKKIVKTAIEEAAKAALNLDLYQVAKLKAVNEFFTVVVLTSRQIEFLDDENDAMLLDSTDMLVVDLYQLKFLEKRIQQLENECQFQLKSIRETQDKHHVLARSKARMTERISQADDEVKKAMKRKFGKMVNMEKIESILVSPALEELMYDFDLIKAKNLVEIGAIERLITSKEADLSQEVRLNTDIINYTLAYKDVSDELAGDLSTKQEDMVIKKQANPVNFNETLALVRRQGHDIVKLKKEKNKLFYCPSLIKRF